MANPAHLEILNQGVAAWNKWREDNPSLVPDLTVANLSERDLRNIKLVYANLNYANLNKANLSNVDISKANLNAAELIGTNLSETYLGCTDFSLANLREANFRKAKLSATIFADCDLTGAKNLETCEHLGWSILDHRTLAQSGNFPIEFLRGCGLPDFIIENISVLQGSAIQYYSCFISYSTKDEEFATRLYADLQNSGVRCWYAPEDMRGGKKLYDQINEAIRIHDKLLLVLSEHSMNSNWVKTEIERAIVRQKQEGKQMLFPISLIPYEKLKEWEYFDSDQGQDFAKEIRTYHIPDFTHWKNHDGYHKEFQKLIKSLKGEKEKT